MALLPLMSFSFVDTFEKQWMNWKSGVNGPEAWPGSSFHRTFQTLISKSHKTKQSKISERHLETCILKLITLETRGSRTKTYRTWRSIMDGDRATWASWGQPASFSLLGGDLRKPGRPQQPQGIVTMQESVPVFSDLCFFPRKYGNRDFM